MSKIGGNQVRKFKLQHFNSSGSWKINLAELNKLLSNQKQGVPTLHKTLSIGTVCVRCRIGLETEILTSDLFPSIAGFMSHSDT